MTDSEMTDSATVDEASSSPRWYWNLPILLLFGILVPLCTRGLIADDGRYSWGTFSKQIVYLTHYRWILRGRDGDVYYVNHSHEGELRGDARTHLGGAPRVRNTRYSLGAVKSWLTGYCRYMYDERDRFFAKDAAALTSERDEVIGFAARTAYVVNVSRNANWRKQLPKETFVTIYPPDAPNPWKDEASDDDSVHDASSDGPQPLAPRNDDDFE